MKKHFSVVMSVYRLDNPGHFKQAIDSVLNQTFLPDMIIVVIDGPINSNLDGVVSSYEENPVVRLERLPENIGLGAARHHAILSTDTPIIAVMDSDDICAPNRFERQMSAINTMDVDVVGAFIAEFSHSPDTQERVREVPLTCEQIIKRGRFFSPINHVTIMFRKDSYLRAGGYKGLRKVEDYDLFHRMVLSGLNFINIPEVLVYVRASDDQYRRRHGVSYLQEEVRLHYGMYRTGYINFSIFLWNIVIRLLIRLMPVSILRWFSKKIMRVNIPS
jgi:glycosyltransferase involved in cell wall biosynthesis